MSALDLLLDTDILIDILREYTPARHWAQENQNLRIGIPVVVRMELIQGARNQFELHTLTQQLDAYTTLYLKTEDSVQALKWFEQLRLSRGVGLLDCFIAAMAHRLQIPLCTFNNKHYSPFDDVHLLAPYPRDPSVES